MSFHFLQMCFYSCVKITRIVKFILYIYLSKYIFGMSVCLLDPKNVETAEPIGSFLFVEPHMTQLSQISPIKIDN